MLRCSLWLTLVACILSSAQFAYPQVSSPASISGLAFHADAHDVLSTGLLANNANIAQWNDLSGNAYNLTGIAGARPVFETTGFSGTRPAVRFEFGDLLTAPDVLPTTSGTMTIFFFTQMIANRKTAAVSLNGNKRGGDRYSFHTPWTDNKAYFDADGTTGSARVNANMPGNFDEEYVFTAVNDLPGNQQILSVDGNIIASDTTGHNGDSSNGLFIGSITNGLSFNGRFGEIIIYNRVLTTAEIDSIQQYLFCKWKPSLATAACAQIHASLTTARVSSPVGNYILPGSTLRHKMNVSNAGPFDADASTTVITNAIPSETTLKVVDIDAVGGGPVMFTDGSPSSGMSYTFTSLSSTLDDVDFSDDDGSTFTYVPTADSLGLDANVTHIRISPKLPFQAGSTSDPSNFEVMFDVLLK